MGLGFTVWVTGPDDSAVSGIAGPAIAETNDTHLRGSHNLPARHLAQALLGELG